LRSATSPAGTTPQGGNNAAAFRCDASDAVIPRVVTTLQTRDQREARRARRIEPRPLRRTASAIPPTWRPRPLRVAAGRQTAPRDSAARVHADRGGATPPDRAGSSTRGRPAPRHHSDSSRSNRGNTIRPVGVIDKELLEVLACGIPQSLRGERETSRRLEREDRGRVNRASR
jgi:hypothetical protein